MNRSGEVPENNIAHHLATMAASQPSVRAVVVSAPGRAGGQRLYSQTTFGQLLARSDRYAWGLASVGTARGTRVLLMVRPSVDFYALTFAIFACGAVPVFIDPGMGWRAFMRCVAQARPEVFIGIPRAHVLRLLFPRYFRSVTTPVTLGRRLFWGGHTLSSLSGRKDPFPVQPVDVHDTAAILFTTGSTGPAKGVTYTHGVFGAQIGILKREYGIGPGDVDLPCFPLFGLFSTVLGATAVIPDMDPSRPAYVDPHAIVDPIVDHGVTYSFGSPTLWARVGRYCVDHRIELPTLRRVIMAGAPVPATVHQDLLDHVLPQDGQTYTPYGATESLPVANFTGREMVADTAAATREGAGMCVGRPLPETEVRIIRIDDGALGDIQDCQDVPPGQVGEIIVRGPVVTRSYDGLPEATRLAKIADGSTIWHRMGDVGYMDDAGRLWFCGRKSHRVLTRERSLYTVCCEAIFNEIFDVARSALVGIGADRCDQTPVIIIEPIPGRFPRSARAREAFRDTVLAVAAQREMTASIRHALFHPAFPVDIRHNAKIRRELLARWAGRRLKCR